MVDLKMLSKLPPLFPGGLCIGWTSKSNRFVGQWRVLSLVEKDPLGCAIKIVVLAAAHRPQERRKSYQTHAESNRDQPGEMVHAASDIRRRAGRDVSRGIAPGSRSALATTRMDEADMAIAAIRGVT